MRTGGILLIAAGGILIYWVLRAGLKSERSSSGSSSSSGGGGGGTKSGYYLDSSSASNLNVPGGDIGTHSAIDTTGTETGTVGDVYTVNSTYGDASGQQQDDMNAFAHAMGG